MRVSRTVHFVVTYIFVVFLFVPGIHSNAEDKFNIEGKGTREKPYLIQNSSDLIYFANEVNSGTDFDGGYFLQTADIDLNDIVWPVIGNADSGCSFNGVYNGGGHLIYNLNVDTQDNNSFFGQLGGKVINLGLESGSIRGKHTGGIAGALTNINAAIINCYTRLSVYGSTSAGFAAISGGVIANSWMDSQIFSESDEELGEYVAHYSNSILNCFNLKEEKDLSTVVSSLNKKLYLYALYNEIPVEDLYFWTLDVSGNNIVFDEKQCSFEVKYLPQMLQYYFMKWTPLTIIMFGLFIFGIIIFNRK